MNINVLIYRQVEITKNNHMRQSNRKLTKDQILQIPELVKTLKGKEIAEKFEVSERTIRAWIEKLRALGYRVPTRKGRRNILDEVKESNK